MDHMRYTEIIEELSDYDPSVKAARVGSTVTIGEIVEMAKGADTIERIQSERTFWHEKWRRDWQALNEARAEVDRVKGELEIEARRPINLMGNQG